MLLQQTAECIDAIILAMSIGAPDVKEILRELDYDPSTGVFVWKGRAGRAARQGRPAGYVTKRGYRYIAVLGKQYGMHRLAWLIMTGEWPGEIDHINGIKDDNRFANLRVATRSQNLANTSKPITNTSGLKGATYYKSRGVWYSQIRVNGERIFLGYHPTKEAAHEAYRAAALRMRGEFARF